LIALDISQPHPPRR